MPFRFRAAAALEIKRKQEDQARLVAAKADTEWRDARQRATDAADAVRRDREALAGAQRHGIESWRAQWHRAWIGRLELEVVERDKDRDERAAASAVAAAAAQEAFKRRRVLERLRDRAFRRHQQVVREQHAKDMNELATLRFVAQLAEGDTRAD